MPMAAFNLEHVKQFRFKQLFVDDLGWVMKFMILSQL